MSDHTTIPSTTVAPSDHPAGEPTAEAGPESFAEQVSRFALSLLDVSNSPVELAEQVVVGALRLIPGAGHAAVVTADGPRRLKARAASGNDIPRLVLDLQNGVQEGPCIDAIADGKLLLVSDVASDIRWPNFGPAAARAGAASMLCIPLITNHRTIGGLTLISASGAFDEQAQILGRVFAAHAAVALASADDVVNLQAALRSRDVIGQAKGILMERFRLTPELAFAALVKASSDSNVKLRAVCQELCDTGLLAGGPGGSDPWTITPDPR